MWGGYEVLQTSKMKGEKCGCVGVAPHVRTSARSRAIQASEMSNGIPEMKPLGPTLLDISGPSAT